ncbi:MAG: GNAT family N-acetyltransferase, partial [Treponemataceae bacterium]|nr:GNAT family N-acetyltransferase [Treponemataceae bacterium]
FLLEEENALPKDFEIVKCNQENLQDLFELQKNYDIVEVIPPGKEFCELNCKTLLRKNLETQIIYAIKKDSKFVAKAGSNAIGKNFIQLGGVFTDENYRGQGFAQVLIKELCKTIRNMNKEPVLFVQVKNESAKRAYRKVGFVYQSDYTICYYN